MKAATQFADDTVHDEELSLETEAADAQVVGSTAMHAEGGETEAERVPATTPGLDRSVETGGTGPGVGAPSEISAKTAQKKKTAWDEKETRRTKAQNERTKARTDAAKDWTIQELKDLLAGQGAQQVFFAINKRSPAQAIDLLKKAGTWDAVLAALPKGKLNALCKTALGQMIEDGLLDIVDAKKLFEKRFAHAADDAGKSWTLPIMQVVWRQLELLPDNDITLNTAITTFEAIAGSGGFGPSWEAPATINKIQLGVDTAAYQHLEHTVRHEIAHGVHTQIPGPINSWLQNDMQFWFISFDQFISDLGGIPATYTPPSKGVETPVTNDLKTWLKDLLEKQWCGSGSWGPKPGITIGAWLASKPDLLALWNACPAPLRNACDQSVSHWYQNYENFQEQGGKRYFLNHWYHRPFTIGQQAMAAIPTTNDNYTAMSEKEFFANCYAEYFEDPEGAKDNTKWGGGLSSAIKDFFKSCIMQRNPYLKFKDDQKKAQEAAKGGGTPSK